MAAPLPTGAQVFALPVAPQADPRMFATNPQAALATMQAGLQLGEELAKLENKRAQRELEAAEIEFKKSENKYQSLLTEDAIKNISSTVGARLQKNLAEIEQSRLVEERAKLTLAAGLPQAQVDVEKERQGNLLRTEKANRASGFADLSTPGQAQTVAAAQAQGSWGVASGTATGAGEVPPPFRETQVIHVVDPVTGNTHAKSVIIDKRNGQQVGPATDLGVVKPGTEQKSVQAQIDEMTALTQTREMAAQVAAGLDKYIEKDAGGIIQAGATVEANKPATGPVSVVRRAMAAKLQNEDTTKIAGQIQNLKNTIGKTLFGAALTASESAQLEGMLPTAGDLADPKRAKEKLQGTIEFLETKLKPYRDRNLLERAGISKPAAAAPAAPAASMPTDWSPAPLGTEREIGGVWYRRELRNGIPGWARIR